jgi:regulatory protein
MRLRRGDSSPGPQDVEALNPSLRNRRQVDPFGCQRSPRKAGWQSNGRPAAPSLRARALRLLAVREHSRLELQRKLGPHAESRRRNSTSFSMSWSVRGLLSVQRVVESLLHQRSAGHGSLRLRQALLAKGLQPADFHEALGQLAETELQRAHALYQRRFGDQPCTQPRDLARRQRYLLGRGFSGEVVRQVLRSAAWPSQDE